MARNTFSLEWFVDAIAWKALGAENVSIWPEAKTAWARAYLSTRETWFAAGLNAFARRPCPSVSDHQL